MSRAHTVTFILESKNSHVTIELVDWLNKNSNIDSLNFDFRYFSEEDGVALSHLADGSKVHVTIRNCESVAGLGSLGKLQWLYLVGGSLPEKLARNVSKRAVHRALRLEVRQLPKDSIAELKGYSGYMQIVGGLDPDDIKAFARLGLESLELSGLTSVPTVTVDEFKNMAKTKHLRIVNSHLDASECKEIAALFQCESLNLYKIYTKDLRRQSSPVTLINPAPELLNFSPDLRESFRELPDLTSARFNGGAWETF